MEHYLRHDGVFLLRLMTMASNALTTVDLTAAMWKHFWKSHPQPTSDVRLSAGEDNQSTMWFNGPRQPGDSDSTVKRKLLHDDQLDDKG